MTAEIRSCGMEDLEALREISYETSDETFRSMNTPQAMTAYLQDAFSTDRLRQELSNPGCRFYFLRVSGTLGGYLKLNEAPAQSDLNDPDSLEIERIYVRKGLQGNGLGTVLVNYSLQAARQLGKKYLWLGVWERNATAIAFYKKMGFSAMGRHAFRMGEELQSDLVMKRTLSD